MKLQQNQVWKKDNDFILVVRLERLSVGYKSFTDLLTRLGTHQTVTKKEFCRLIKGATLLTPEEQKSLLEQAIEAAQVVLEPTPTVAL